jgi:pimeloyl-ACP methyl ester carboxylesterase
MMGISKRHRVSLCTALVPAMLLMLCGKVFAGQYVRVSPDLELYYEEAGSGAPIVFIPGWTGSTAVMHQQLSHFSKRYRAISYDPRSQGRSSKTLENNNHTQHGDDLRAFMIVLMLENAVLVGHSSGCYDVYAYFRAFGTDNVKAFVCIDQPPKEVMDYEGDWAFISDPSEYKAFYSGLISDRLKTTREFVPSMVSRPMTDQEIDRMVDDMMRTPTYVAAALILEMPLLNYTAEAKLIDGKIPVLNVLAESRIESGKVWLAENAPNSEVAEFDLHLMFWEFPDRFNAVVDDFLRNIE